MSERANFIWDNLPFDFNGTDGYCLSVCRNGKWTPWEVIHSPYIQLHIAAGALHYAQEIFEGMRCFEWANSQRYFFRPAKNAARFKKSAEIMAMPPLPEDHCLEGVRLAADINRRLQPPFGSGASLYIRPFMIATGPQLGVRQSDEHTAIIYATPVGPYFKGGFSQTLSAFLTKQDRVPMNGKGNAKTGGNYAATISALFEAKVNGCHTPLFSKPPEHKIVTETHASNVGFIIDGVFYTPAQDSFILDSVTRRSVVELCQNLSTKVVQDNIYVSELRAITEAFGMGTGATIAPISRFRDSNGWLKTAIAEPDKPGEITTRLYRHLTGIQQGIEEDIFNWNYGIV